MIQVVIPAIFDGSVNWCRDHAFLSSWAGPAGFGGAFECLGSGLRLRKHTVNPDFLDKDVVSAVRRGCLKSHPDKGGTVERQQQLNAAKAAWDDARAKAR